MGMDMVDIDMQMGVHAIHLTVVIGMAYHHLRHKRSVGQHGSGIEMIVPTVDYHQDHPRLQEIIQIMMVAEVTVRMDIDLVHEI